MKAYFHVFFNWEQNDWARLLLMAKFPYNNSKNANMGHIPFEFHCGYYPWVIFENKCNARSRSSSANRLAVKLRELINIYHQNLLHAQDLQKQSHNKGVKPCVYAAGENIWLNSKYIKTKWNRKLKAKFFRPFWVLHLVEKQAYKLGLPAK